MTETEEHAVLVEAKKRYNGPFLLKAGYRYEFEVQPEEVGSTDPPQMREQTWRDAGTEANAEGYERARLNPFRGLRRNRDAHWFELVAEIDGEQSRMGQGIAESNADRVIYCYANDAWYMYWNNRGALTLTVRGTKAA